MTEDNDDSQVSEVSVSCFLEDILRYGLSAGMKTAIKPMSQTNIW